MVRVSLVSIQDQNQCATALDDSYACVSMPIDTTFVPLGEAKEPFELKVVDG